ncbi:diacylglycerol O-acyltransferase [Mycobacterium sp. 852013-50091_SCH5140682]|uniref:wax ester/triacylglycerol synthase family O-acyltransferase n=1 Tax=Mycobacterium sp. 852013-50091_SCH5140682 TaxID=1834109 RepID=UPI0007E9A762|nr:wax ester/triacylglycerol synthase family O-acyltransferase [Mycobacterium sp. 852013-50091_SCH5140682]OBC00390.1 diacylglycerol O-acyltransferase [Mycobacterium sp. 852013-50091_SCH5140682]
MNWMGPLDAAMITADVISNPLNIGAVLVLSPPPGSTPDYLDQVYADSVIGRVVGDPRLRRYPHRGIDTAGVWVWRELDVVDVGRHCQRVTLTPGESLWKLISALHAEPLARSRPMWMSYLIDGLDDGRFAFYIKMHHTVMDGVTGLQTLADVLSPDPRCRSSRGFYAEPKTRTPAVHRGFRLPNPLALLGAVTKAGSSAAALAAQVVTGEVARIAASVTGDTALQPLAAPYVRFNGRLGRERVVSAATLPSSRFQAVRRETETTANDVITAVIAGALRRWLTDHDELPHRSLVAICPIAVHPHDHRRADQPGNMFGAWLCPLGTDLVDPAERLDRIHRSMSEGKHEVAARGAAASLLLLAASIAPTVLLPMLPFAPRLRAGYNLPISHVPGPRDEMYWNGAHVEEIYPISAVYDGQALNVTTCSYADRVGFGYVAGGDVMPDITELGPLTEQALAELETAVGVT